MARPQRCLNQSLATAAILCGLAAWACTMGFGFGFSAKRPAAPFPEAVHAAPAKAQASARIPIVLDTDIGDDIDDTWALIMLLKSPELDLKLVTTTFGKADYRAKIVAKILSLAGQTEVAVGLGAGGRGGTGGQAAWVEDFDLEHYTGKVHEDGVRALIDLVNASPQPITLISIGPSNTLAEALARDPGIASKAVFVGMQGSIRKGYDGGAGRVKSDFSTIWLQNIPGKPSRGAELAANKNKIRSERGVAALGG